MRSFRTFIGVDLGGGKGRNTAVAVLRAVDEPGPAKVEVVRYGTGGAASFYDPELLRTLLEEPDALVAIDAPLTLPACVRCTLPACPSSARCEVPILRWFREAAARQDATKKPKYTPYTQRATEVLLHERHGIMPRETLGQGMGPLTARAAYLVRALSPTFRVGENLIEVYPKATLHQLFGEDVAKLYKRSAAAEVQRTRGLVLERLPELRFALGVWRNPALELANDHDFDAIIAAYTAYLYSRQACEPPPDEVVAADGWIWAPTRAGG